MLTSRFPLCTLKETPADADTDSHRLMLRAGMIRKLAAGIYSWLPLGLRVLRKVESVVREEMLRAGAVELLMPSVQPKELWEESGRWDKYGHLLLRMQDRKEQWYCYGPTHEEVICDIVRNEIRSYKQLPLTLFQIQTKFRDEIRPRFGVMRAREFVMKDAYSFHLDQASLDTTYRVMRDAYARIFTRLGLKFREVQADSGDIGGDISHEFQVLAESGEDAIAFSDQSDYAANVELAEAVAPAGKRPEPKEEFLKISTPGKTSCEDVATYLKIPINRTVKSIAIVGSSGFGLVLVRGDHEINETKLRKIKGFENYRLATENEIQAALECKPGYIGPTYLNASQDPASGKKLFTQTKNPLPSRLIYIRLIIDKTVDKMSDFVCGANEPGYHCIGVNLDRDIKPGYEVHDVRKVVESDPSPDGKGVLKIARGIEVGHIFQNGRKYTDTMHVGVLNEQGKLQAPLTGCYGIGVSRIVAAAIEQNHDERGIIWPEPLAPFQIALLPLNMHKSEKLRAVAQALYQELIDAGYDLLMDDRELRPGPMFADMELIGIPHRLVLSERSLDTNTVEYKGRCDDKSQDIDHDKLLAFLKARIQVPV